MPIPVVSCFTHLTRTTVLWTDAHHSVNKFKNALKGKAIKGWGSVLVKPDEPTRKLEQKNVRDAFEWFGQMAAVILDEHHISKTAVLVPIPDSKCTRPSQPPRTLALAVETARQSSMKVADVLRWTKEMRSASSESGPRDPFELCPFLQWVRSDIKADACVLIDDVLTSGGHIRAASAIVRGQGATVVLAICGVRADDIPSDKPFDRRHDQLEDFVWSG